MPEHPLFTEGTPHGGPPDDDALQAMLRDALQGVRTGAVDEHALSVGAGTRLRRQRRNRRLGAATAGVLALAVAVPLTVQALSDPVVRTVPAAPASSSAGPPPAPSVSVPASGGTALMSPQGGRPRSEVAYAVPELPLLTAALPENQELFDDQGQYAGSVTVDGQGCPGGREDVGPAQVAGRWWTYLKPNTRRVTPPGTGVVVTGWATGSGHQAFEHLVENTGACRFGAAYGHSQSLYDLTVPGAQESWATRSEVMGTVWGASRVGDLIVAVTIDGMLADEAAPLLPPLLEAAVADLRASGLPAAQGR